MLRMLNGFLKKKKVRKNNDLYVYYHTHERENYVLKYFITNSVS